MARRVILLTSLFLIGLLAFLTLYVLFNSGPDLLVFISLLVLAIMGIGIFGALGEPPRGGKRR